MRVKTKKGAKKDSAGKSIEITTLRPREFPAYKRRALKEIEKRILSQKKNTLIS